MSRTLENLYFEVSGACNLLCQHCYIFEDDRRRAREDRLTPEIVETTVRQALALGLTTCTFTGGEILIRRDLVEILEGAGRHVDRLFLLTNLTLLNRRVLDALRRLPIELVSTSIDGLPATHDRLRGRVGAYDKTMRAVGQLQDAGIPVKVSVTVTPENLDETEELFAQLDAAGVPSSIARVTAVGRGKRTAARSVRFDQRYSLQLARRLGRSISNQQVRGLKAPGKEVATYCGVGASILYVMSDGEVGYCPTMTPATDPRWRLGNICDTTIVDIWRGGSIFGTDDLTCSSASSCSYGSVCRGGCRSNAYTATGDARACDTEMRDGLDALSRLPSPEPAQLAYRVT